MKTDEMEAFASVVMSDHPEEVLCDCPCGQVEEREATLSKGAKVRWETDDHGRPRKSSRAFTLPTAVKTVRTFSADGKSDFVNALIPGLGHCLVQRDDLTFRETENNTLIEHELRSLTIQFDKYNDEVAMEGNSDEGEEDAERGVSKIELPATGGLALFLEKIGSTLKTLALDGPRADLDENLILRSCPNLEKLSLCGGIVDVQLCFNEYRKRGQPIATLKCHWHNLAALSAALSDTSNPLVNCVRKLRVRLKDEWEGWTLVPHSYNPPDFEANANALLQMLSNNQRLEYLEVIAPEEQHYYVDRFRSHHLKPIKRSIGQLMKCHIPFLSVISSLRALSQPTKKQKASALNLRRVVSALDQHLLANIIVFAVGPSLRQAYFRSLDSSD